MSGASFSGVFSPSGWSYTWAFAIFVRWAISYSQVLMSMNKKRKKGSQLQPKIELQEMKKEASDAQLQLKTELQEMTKTASDAKKKLVQAQQNVNAKNVVIVKLSARINDMKDHHKDELEKEVANKKKRNTLCR